MTCKENGKIFTRCLGYVKKMTILLHVASDM